MKMSIPVVGKIVTMSGASQFAHTMSTMLAAGMPIPQALEVSGRAITNYCMSKAVLDTISGVESGKTVGECMSQSRDLPAMLVQMTSIGESTGSMEDTLQVMAEYYDNEVDTATARALSCSSRSSSFCSPGSSWSSYLPYTCRCSACTAQSNQR